MATKKASTKKSSSAKGSTKKASSTKKSAAKKSAAKKSTTKKSTTKKRAASKTSKRTLIEPHPGDKRYVRRNKKGEFNKVVDVGRSLAADRRSKSKTKSKPGQGDKGDR